MAHPRRQEFIKHGVHTLIGQRMFGIALGYEDLNDHNVLRHDPVTADQGGKLEASMHLANPVCAPPNSNVLKFKNGWIVEMVRMVRSFGNIIQRFAKARTVIMY